MTPESFAIDVAARLIVALLCHGLSIEPGDGKVHASTYTATK